VLKQEGGEDLSEGLDGRITDEDVARARAQIGIRTPSRSPFWNPVPDRSSISHFAFGYGDDNPLWHDAEYGKTTRWRDQIAPPMYLATAGINETPQFDSPALKDLFRGLFRGVGKYLSQISWEWFRPVYAGDAVFVDGRTTVDLTERRSSFAGGRSVIETYRTVYVGRTGEVIAVTHETYVNAERSGSKATAKHTDVQRQNYTDEELKQIDKDYANERRQGSDHRLWEDVTPGQILTPIVKGPLTVLDMISHHMAHGYGGYGIGPLRYGWKKRQAMPSFYVKDDFGVPDVVQRMHWDVGWANSVGLPAPYDYGVMRASWLSHLATNWMGDDAWLWKFSSELRGFNFLGDTHWITGEVTHVNVVSEHCVAELEIQATNQRGSVTTLGRASVILPSVERGPIQLPIPTSEMRRYGAEVVANRVEANSAGRNS